jgi:hypothetical protein
MAGSAGGRREPELVLSLRGTPVEPAHVIQPLGWETHIAQRKRHLDCFVAFGGTEIPQVRYGWPESYEFDSGHVYAAPGERPDHAFRACPLRFAPHVYIQHRS